jgi:hypothetical protein
MLLFDLETEAGRVRSRVTEAHSFADGLPVEYPDRGLGRRVIRRIE